MRWRDGILTVGAALAAVLPGCAHRAADREPAGPAPVVSVPRPTEPVPPQPLVMTTLPAEPVVQPVQHTPEKPAPLPRLEVEPMPVQETRAKATEDPLLAALRCFLEQHPAEAVEWLKSYDKASQEVLLCLLPLTARVALLRLEQASPQELAAVLEQLNTLAAPLRSRAALNIEKMCFCKEIKRYGVYDPWPAEHVFQPGDPVQVYVELRNFSSERQGNNYLTRLAGRVQIKNFEGKVVWQDNRLSQLDKSQTSRHDYFLNFYFDLPFDLSPGLYTLWIQVEDVPTQRIIKRSLDFRVAAGGSASR